MIDGARRTEEWIDRWDVRDSSGRRHWPHGIWTSEARLTSYVCFDDHPWIGRHVWSFFTRALQDHAVGQSNQKPVFGSTGRSSAQKTGAGYLFETKRGGFDLWLDRKDELSPEAQDDPERWARACFEARGRFGAIRIATMREQLSGVDFFVPDPLRSYGVDPIPVEVKSRMPWQGLGKLFLQISETNPDKLIR